MAIAEELIVALKSQGAEETKRQVDAVGDSVKDVEQDVSASSDRLSGLTRKIKGFMSAIVAGIALAAGGLATQIPVLGGLFEGLASVFSAVGFQLDKRLRPFLEPIIDGFYELSAAIFAGDWETVRQFFTDIGEALVEFDYASAIESLLMSLSNFTATIFNTLAGLDFRGLLQQLVTRIANISDAIDWRSILRPIIDGVANFINSTDWLGLAADIIKALRGAMIAFFKGVNWNDWYKYIKGGLETWVDNTDFTQIAKDILSGIGNYLLDNITFWKETFAEPIAGFIVEGIEDAIEAEIGMGIEVDINNDGPGIGVSADPAINPIMGGERTRTISMDGRELDESLGRYGRDTTTRRGI